METDLIFIYAAVILIYLVIIILMIASWWTIFSKANKPGYIAIIPIYNIIVLLEIIGKPKWWLLFLFIPVINLYFSFKIFQYLALSFEIRWDIQYGIFVHLLPFVLIPYLAFSRRYCGIAIQSPMRTAVQYKNYPD